MNRRVEQDVLNVSDFCLEKTAELAKERKYDYFTTTLSVSPHKNSQLLNELGKEIGRKVRRRVPFWRF